MTDRELVRLAAKAFGFDYDGTDVGLWNPLLNSGDALDLAAGLRINIRFSTVPVHRVIAIVPAHVADAAEIIDDEENEVDALRSTRRAIVRAAAEIGRRMES